jgi:hypothetical protein
MNDWIFIQNKKPEINEQVEILHDFFGVMVAKRVPFNVPTKNPFNKEMEYWFWDVENPEVQEAAVVLLNEICHWRYI